MVVTDTEPERPVPLPRQRDQSVRQMLTNYRLASGDAPRMLQQLSFTPK